MIIETKRKRRTYKEPIIIYEYQTNRNRGFIEKTPIYVIEREKSFKIVAQKGIRYFTYKLSLFLKEESGIVLKSPIQNNSFLYLLADDDNKAKELFLEHFDKLKEEEKNKLELAKVFYNREIAILDCLSLLEIREDKE